jgi:hypothetical protein
LEQPVALPVIVTGVPTVAVEGGIAVALIAEQPTTSLNERTSVPADTKICPPASLGVEKWFTPKLPLW